MSGLGATAVPFRGTQQTSLQMDRRRIICVDLVPEGNHSRRSFGRDALFAASVLSFYLALTSARARMRVERKLAMLTDKAKLVTIITVFEAQDFVDAAFVRLDRVRGSTVRDQTQRSPTRI